MPKKKQRIIVSEKTETNTPIVANNKPEMQQPIFTKKNILLLVILIVIVVFWKFRGWFVAAMVNGQPISRMEYNSQLEKRFGSQVLENLINERLITGAVRQKGIFVTAEEIDQKIKEVESKLQGSMNLDDALKAQGLNKDDFRRQIDLQLSIERLFEKESTVSSAEVDNYLEKNRQAFKSATDPAQVKLQIYDILHQQKISDEFNKWFEEIKKSANVSKFVN